MKRICVFCGSNAGHDARYRAEAEALGRLLASRGIELVYGGGNVGLMGIVADAALAAGGDYHYYYGYYGHPDHNGHGRGFLGRLLSRR